MLTAANAVDVTPARRKANQDIVYEGGGAVFDNFVSALAAAKASPADAAKLLALKQKLYLMVRMDIEMLTGPLVRSEYKPHIFKNMDASLRAVTKALSEPDPLELAAEAEAANQVSGPDAAAHVPDGRERAEAILQKGAELSGVAQEKLGTLSEGAQSAYTSFTDAVGTDNPLTAAVTYASNAISEGEDTLMHLSDVISSSAEFMPLFGPAMSFARASSRLLHAIGASRTSAFVTARSTGVGIERARQNARLGLHSSCRMLQLLQGQLEALIKISRSGEGAEKLVALLGAPPALVALLSPAEARHIGRSLAAALCAVLVPVHTRINAIYRPYGICGAGDASKPPFGSRLPAEAALISHEAGTVETPTFKPALARSKEYMPTVATCHADDIYDVVLAPAGDAAAWARRGYAPIAGPDPAVFIGLGGELNGSDDPKEKGTDKNAFGVKYDYSGPPVEARNSRTLFVLTCGALRGKLAAGGSGPDAALYRRLVLPVTDLRVVARGKSRTHVLDDPAAEEEGLIKAGFVPLMLSVAGGADRFPEPDRTVEEWKQPQVVVNADCRFGQGGRSSAVFIYVARGGPAPLTGIQLVPFTVPFQGAWASPAADPALLASLTQMSKTVTAKSSMLGISKSTRGMQSIAGSLVTISNAATFTSLEQKRTVDVLDLGAPAGCVVQTTLGWAWFSCPDNDCNTAVTAEVASASMGRIKKFFKKPSERPADASSLGIVTHNFHTVCSDAAVKSVALPGGPGAQAHSAPTRSWERVVPSPYEDTFAEVRSFLDSARVKLATTPYLWLQRRYASPAFEAHDQLHCAAEQVEVLPPVKNVRDMTAADGAGCAGSAGVELSPP